MSAPLTVKAWLIFRASDQSGRRRARSRRGRLAGTIRLDLPDGPAPTVEVTPVEAAP